MTRQTDDRFKVQYSKADIPEYFKFAHNFTLCDSYFSEVAGPSTPNHFMLICADAPTINKPAHHYNPRAGDAYNIRSLPMQLERAGKTWANYGGYAFHFINELAGHKSNHTRDLFLHDARAGRLPSVSRLYGDGQPDLFFEHPKQNVTDGSNWTAEQVKAIVDGGLLSKTAVFVT